jgi:hypothetical protein
MRIVQLGHVSAAVVASSSLVFTAPLDYGGREHGESSGTTDTIAAVRSARSCAEIVNERQPLRIRLVPTGLQPEVLNTVRQEIAEIWREYQIDIVFESEWTGESRGPRPDLFVQFVNVQLQSKMSGAEAVAWIPFTDGRPLSFVRVSLPTAMALLKTRSWFDNRPLTHATPTMRDEALGRIIGRAVAHEIGHYLLASRTHAKHGLMKASIPPDVLVKPGTTWLKLEQGEVRALRAARVASCELAALRP